VVPEESTTPDLKEVLRRIVEAVNRRDFDAAFSLYAPDVCLSSAAGPTAATASSKLDLGSSRSGETGDSHTQRTTKMSTRPAPPPNSSPRSGGVGGGGYYGHDGMRRWHRDLEGAWGEQIRIQPDVYFDLGEDTLIFFVYHGRGEHSGAEVAMQATSVARWRDGVLTRSTVYLDRAHALRDLGVTEDELEPIAP